MKLRLHERMAGARYERRRQHGRLLRTRPYDFGAFVVRYLNSDAGRSHIADNVVMNNALMLRLKAKAA